jgi:hypothetical protein
MFTISGNISDTFSDPQTLHRKGSGTTAKRGLME